MAIGNITDRKLHEDAKAFIRLFLGDTVARAASHIRSKRAASLCAGIAEVRAAYRSEHGIQSEQAFLECIEQWLLERGSTVAAAALRTYLERAQSVAGDANPTADEEDALDKRTVIRRKRG